MVTFCIIAVAIVALLLVAVGGITVVGAFAGGMLLIVLDIAVGVAPFVGLFFLIRWLLKKRG